MEVSSAPKVPKYARRHQEKESIIEKIDLNVLDKWDLVNLYDQKERIETNDKDKEFNKDTVFEIKYEIDGQVYKVPATLKDLLSYSAKYLRGKQYTNNRGKRLRAKRRSI